VKGIFLAEVNNRGREKRRKCPQSSELHISRMTTKAQMGK